MLINTINGKHKVEFDKGRFDNWCVYVTSGNNSKYAPVDTDYFTFFKDLGTRHGANKVYNDFVKIYDVTTAYHDKSVIELIKTIAVTYNEDAEDAELWFSVIYGGMIAEENKANAILKKRIKRLGMHQLLIENYEPQVAATFSIKKPWKDLNKLMIERGFGV